MIRKKLRKKIRKNQVVQDLVQSTAPIAKKASGLNPLSDNQPEPIAPEDVPRITNETIAEHREEVLSGARKYIYPLSHSKHRIVFITTGIILATIIIFLIYCTLGLYRFYQHNTFLYRVTQAAPFPIARAGGSFIEYENYLFELRHYVHYYQNQLDTDFEGDDKEQLLQYRKQALEEVIDFTYIKKLAQQNGIKVSNQEVDERIEIVREQNRLGSNSKVLGDVLRDYWGWSLADFKRSLSQRILIEKVVAKLDTDTYKQAEDALAKLKSGADFSKLAKEISDDPVTKNSGGEYGIAITKSNPNIPPAVTQALFNLKPGEISGIINTGTTLEIVKLDKKQGDSVVARHISLNLKNISEFVNPLKEKDPQKPTSVSKTFRGP